MQSYQYTLQFLHIITCNILAGFSTTIKIIPDKLVGNKKTHSCTSMFQNILLEVEIYVERAK